jgi:hypothetical protein
MGPEVHDFSGEVQNDLRGGAHLPSKSGLGKISLFCHCIKNNIWLLNSLGIIDSQQDACSGIHTGLAVGKIPWQYSKK